MYLKQRDSFFNDIYHPYENPDDIDILLYAPRNDIYQNVTFCQEGYKYLVIIYNLMVANFLFPPKVLQNSGKNVTKNDKLNNVGAFTKYFISNLIDFNLDFIRNIFFQIIFYHLLI